MKPLEPVQPIHTADLFEPLQRELIDLLRNLTPEDWRRPTACSAWAVQDIAAHLFDGDVRRLSVLRDSHFGPGPDQPIASYGDLVDYLNGLNATWVAALRRASPALLVDLLEFTGPRVTRLFTELDPEAPAVFPVSWAGEEVSPNWFDTAREYTEKWLHQQQIRDATERPPLTSRRWLHPVLDTFVRGLPHAYRESEAAESTEAVVRITGEAGDLWTLRRTDGEWELLSGEAENPAAEITLHQDTAWRLFTKGMTPEDARERLQLKGDEALGEPLLGLLAIMA